MHCLREGEIEDSEEASEGHRVLAEELVLQARLELSEGSVCWRDLSDEGLDRASGLPQAAGGRGSWELG